MSRKKIRLGTAFMAVFAMLIVFVNATRADDASSAGLSPHDIYVRMVGEMRTFQAPPYLQYRDDASYQTNSKTEARTWRMTYRQRDGMARQERMENGAISGPTYVNVINVSPTLVMMARGEDTASQPAPDPSSPRVIATVSAVSDRYSLAFGPVTDVPGCATPYHLMLTPLSDPLRNNLRELWIDAKTFRICRGALVARMTFIFAHPIGDLLFDVNEQGFIYHSVMTGTAHTMFVATRMRSEDTYSNMTPAESEPDSTFNGK